MTTLLIDESLLGQLKTTVAPILEAKAVPLGDLDSSGGVERLLGNSLRLWPIELHRPRPGERFRLDFSGQRRLTIHDARVFMEDPSARPSGPENVLVKKVYGEFAVCALVDDVISHGQAESHRVLALSGRLFDHCGRRRARRGLSSRHFGLGE